MTFFQISSLHLKGISPYLDMYICNEYQNELAMRRKIDYIGIQKLEKLVQNDEESSIYRLLTHFSYEF